MNLTKLAKLSGYSLSTVSKAFRNSPEISESTRNKIFDLAREHDCFDRFYSPTYKKRVFAVLCKEITNSVYGNLIDSLSEKISKAGDILLISSTHFSSSALTEQLDYFTGYHKVDGIFIIHENFSGEGFSKKVPTVVISTVKNELPCYFDCVETDQTFGMEDAVRHLIRNGHRKIGFIGEMLTGKKAAVFQDILRKNNLEVNPDWIFTSTMRKAKAGCEGAEHLLSLQNRPTAVFTAYDAIAFGLIYKLHQAYLKVPEHLSVVSCNDIPLSAYATPPLSTVALPVQDMIDTALSLMDHRLENADAPLQQVSIQSQFLVRDSVFNIAP